MALITNIKGMQNRLSWDEYFMTVAYLISNRSTCEKLHVGAVIIRDKRIITTGYNGHIPGSPHSSLQIDGHEQMTIHAETNAIADAAKRGISLMDSTVYVTHFPCINCTKNLIASGIKEVIYGEDYHNNEICLELFKLGNIMVKKYEQK
jgi:dCMP deaminase